MRGSEKLADGVEESGICCRVRPWRFPDGRLIDAGYFVEVFVSGEGIENTWPNLCVSIDISELVVQNIVNQRAFPRARHASNTGKNSQGNGHIDIAEVVGSCTFDADPFFGSSPFL